MADVGALLALCCKDHRRDLPQVVIGLAVTREGIPIRVWTWPGNASEQELIRQVNEDLRAWKLSCWSAGASWPRSSRASP